MLNEEETREMLKIYTELRDETTEDRYYNGAVMACKKILEIAYP